MKYNMKNALHTRCMKYNMKYTVQNTIHTQGVLPNMMKLAPAAGVSWFVFEEVKMLLGIDVRS